MKHKKITNKNLLVIVSAVQYRSTENIMLFGRIQNGIELLI